MLFHCWNKGKETKRGKDKNKKENKLFINPQCKLCVARQSLFSYDQAIAIVQCCCCVLYSLIVSSSVFNCCIFFRLLNQFHEFQTPWHVQQLSNARTQWQFHSHSGMSLCASIELLVDKDCRQFVIVLKVIQNSSKDLANSF